MAEEEFKDPYQLTWGRPFVPSSKIRTWVGVDADVVEVTEDEIKVKVRAGYWTDKKTTLGHGEVWNAYLYSGPDSASPTATTGISYYLNEHGDGSHGSWSSEASVCVFCDKTVSVPRKSVDYSVTAWVSGTFWGTWADGNNGLGAKVSLKVPRKDNDAYNLHWGREFRGSNGLPCWLGLHVWPTKTTRTSQTLRVRAAYWTDGLSRLTSADRWSVAVADGAVTLDVRSGSGDMASAPITSDRTAAYMEDFTVDVDLKAAARKVAVTLTGTIFGRECTAGGLGVRLEWAVPQVGVDAPDPPASPSAELADGVATLTWESAADPDKGKPWDSVALFRSEDGADPVKVAEVGPKTRVWRDTSCKDGHGYRWGAQARNAAGASETAESAEVWSRPTAPASVACERVSDTSVAVAWSHDGSQATGFEVQRRPAKAGGSWSTVSEDGDLSGSSRRFLDAEALGEAARYRVRTKSKGGQSPWAEGGEVAYTCAPEAPATGGVAAGQVVRSDRPRPIEWEPNHPDASAQTAAQVDVDGQVSTVAGEARSFELAGLADGDHTARVRTHGLSSEWGAWSAPVAFTVASPPAVTVTRPAADGALVSSLPLEVAWEAFSLHGVVSASVAVMRADGTSAGVVEVPGGTALTVDGGMFDLSNDRRYTVVVTATDGLGLTGSGSVAIQVSFVPPALPSVRVQPDEESLCCYLWCDESDESVRTSAKAGAFQAGCGLVCADGSLKWQFQAHPATDHYEVWREDASGELERVAAGVRALDMVVDPTPPLNAPYRYRVDAVSADGERASRWVEAYLDSHDAVALNYGAALDLMATLVLDLDCGTGAERAGEAYHFAGAGSSARWEGAELPVFYPGPAGSGTADVSGAVVGLEAARSWLRAFRSGGTALYRDLFGERRYVAVRGSVDVSHTDGRQWNVSASMEEVARG